MVGVDRNPKVAMHLLAMVQVARLSACIYRNPLECPCKNTSGPDQVAGKPSHTGRELLSRETRKTWLESSKSLWKNVREIDGK